MDLYSITATYKSNVYLLQTSRHNSMPGTYIPKQLFLSSFCNALCYNVMLAMVNTWCTSHKRNVIPTPQLSRTDKHSPQLSQFKQLHMIFIVINFSDLSFITSVHHSHKRIFKRGYEILAKKVLQVLLYLTKLQIS